MSLLPILFHQSQWPERLRRGLLGGLERGRIPHKFLYESHRQAAAWVRLHEAFSPAFSNSDCIRIYQDAFKAAAGHLCEKPVHVVGLGAGSGQKDSALARQLGQGGVATCYTAIDVGAPMVLRADAAVGELLPESRRCRVVCDLADAPDLAEMLRQIETQWSSLGELQRLILFFGMVPNFEPDEAMRLLAQAASRAGWVIFSANLAPGSDYRAGTLKILDQYDNDLTREWLLAFLDYVGISRQAGEIRFKVQEEQGFYRVVAEFVFRSDVDMSIEGQRLHFAAGNGLRLFYSYRHTPGTIRDLAAKHGLLLEGEWISACGQEGVFAARLEGR